MEHGLKEIRDFMIRMICESGSGVAPMWSRISNLFS